MADEETDLSSPSGSASPGPGVGARRVAEILSEAECMELLASEGVGVGRLVYNSRYGPTALPVDDGHEKLPRDGQIAARWRS